MSMPAFLAAEPACAKLLSGDEGLACVAPEDGSGSAAAAQPEEATCQVFLTEFKDAALPLPTLVIDNFQEAQQRDASLSASFDVRCSHAPDM